MSGEAVPPFEEPQEPSGPELIPEIDGEEPVEVVYSPGATPVPDTSPVDAQPPLAQQTSSETETPQQPISSFNTMRAFRAGLAKKRLQALSSGKGPSRQYSPFRMGIGGSLRRSAMTVDQTSIFPVREADKASGPCGERFTTANFAKYIDLAIPILDDPVNTSPETLQDYSGAQEMLRFIMAVAGAMDPDLKRRLAITPMALLSVSATYMERCLPRQDPEEWLADREALGRRVKIAADAFSIAVITDRDLSTDFGV